MSAGDEDLVLFENKGAYGILTLNRPDKRNAMNRPAQRALWAALDEAKEARVKVIIVTGAGDVSFCAGADTRDESPKALSTAVQANTWVTTQQLIAAHPAVFLAAVNGYALGGGLTLVHNCDLAIAAETATFGAPEITFGIYAALAGPSTVKRVLPKHAAQMVLTGERIDAVTAERYGIVNEVVPADRLLARAEELAQKIAEYDASALDVSKQSMRQEATMSWDEALDHGSRSTAYVQALRKSNEL